jgi:hypothetical protein
LSLSDDGFDAFQKIFGGKLNGGDVDTWQCFEAHQRL